MLHQLLHRRQAVALLELPSTACPPRRDGTQRCTHRTSWHSHNGLDQTRSGSQYRWLCLRAVVAAPSPDGCKLDSHSSQPGRPVTPAGIQCWNGLSRRHGVPVRTRRSLQPRAQALGLALAFPAMDLLAGVADMQETMYGSEVLVLAGLHHIEQTLESPN